MNVTHQPPDSVAKAARGHAFRYAVPALIGAVTLLAALGGEPVRLALRYQRESLADGELWRLATGHLVHLGISHWLLNLAALAVMAFVLGPLLRQRDWLLATLTSSLAIDAGLYFMHPAVAWYVGLSGVLHGFWAAASVNAVWLRRPEAMPLILLLLVKLGYETVAGPLPLTGEIAAGPVVSEAHAWGAVGGTAGALVIAIRRGQRWL